MDLQRKIQQLRNDGDDEFADAIEDMIPRAEVADALAELLKCFSNARDLHSAAANDKDYQGEEEVSARLSTAAVSWQDAALHKVSDLHKPEASCTKRSLVDCGVSM